jgi:hypothetical protein
MDHVALLSKVYRAELATTSLDPETLASRTEQIWDRICFFQDRILEKCGDSPDGICDHIRAAAFFA